MEMIKVFTQTEVLTSKLTAVLNHVANISFRNCQDSIQFTWSDCKIPVSYRFIGNLITGFRSVQKKKKAEIFYKFCMDYTEPFSAHTWVFSRDRILFTLGKEVHTLPEKKQEKFAQISLCS